MKPAVSYRPYLMKILKDPETASAYLNEALEAGDTKAFLLALRNVMDAQGGMTRFSRLSKINRVSLYKMLSTNGNPGFDNILRLLQGAGIRLRVVPQSKNGKLKKATKKGSSLNEQLKQNRLRLTPEGGNEIVQKVLAK